MFCIGIFITKFECLKRKLEIVTLKLLKTDTVRRLNSEEVVTWRLRVKRKKNLQPKKEIDYQIACLERIPEWMLDSELFNGSAKCC